jgi:hypothetical protein
VCLTNEKLETYDVWFLSAAFAFASRLNLLHQPQNSSVFCIQFARARLHPPTSVA